MMDFAVISLPRSGSTWVANWLTDGARICYHDPLSWATPEILTAHESGKPWGIACTGWWMTGKPIPAKRVLIIDRDPNDVNQSLVRIGLQEIPGDFTADFSAYPGKRMPFSALWDEDSAAAIWYYLTGTEMDRDRYHLLRDMNIQPEFRRWTPDAAVLRQIVEELQ